MTICAPITMSFKNAVSLKGPAPINLHMGGNICGVLSRGRSSSYCFSLHTGNSKKNHDVLSACTTSSGSSIMSQTCQGTWSLSCFSKQMNNLQYCNSGGPQKRHLKVSLACQRVNMRILLPKEKMIPKIKCHVGPITWPEGRASAGLIFGLLVCYSSSKPVHAEGSFEDLKKGDCDPSYVKFLHGKKVYTNYSVIGIPGDGRCLFRSVAHGACIRSGKSAPSESLQRELADELRSRVADEFIKRREETEWFVEGDFDTYVSRIRKPHVWGGEPELFMASHVLQMPITVYMYDEDAGGLISIAEYGQEYGKDNPIRVLYHGFGHYDALEIPGKKDVKSRL